MSIFKPTERKFYMKRFIFAVTVFISLLLLISCTGGENSEDVTTEDPIEDITFIGGEIRYTIIRPESTDDATLDAAIKLHTELGKFGDIELGIDWIKSGDPIPAYEILVGDVKRDETAALLRDVPYCGFMVKVVGQKIVVLATNSDYIDDAVDHLIGLCGESGLTLAGDYLFIKDFMDGNYPLKDARLSGTPLSEYEISCKKQNYTQILQKLIGEQTGYCLPVATSDSTAPKIFIGQSADTSATALKYYDYSIESKDKNVYIRGYSENETCHALKVFVNLIEAANDNNLVLTEILDSYTLPDREEYIKDPSKLYMLWDYIWEAPDWMLDYDLKKSDLFGGKGSERLYALAHRGETDYYPENSIEGIISAYFMGAAIMEIDLGVTKDGVLVLIHDDNLKRTTNVSEFVGKEGYPKSTLVSDWTLEQLRSLNLKEGNGGNSAKLTPFTIPTLEEALIVAKDRFFLDPDKIANWQYLESNDLMQDSKKYYLLDDMKKTGNYESIFIYGNAQDSKHLTAEELIKLQQRLKTETGVAPFILFRSTSGEITGYYNYFSKYAEPGTFALQPGGNLNKDVDYSTPYRLYGDEIVLFTWTIGDGDDWNDYRSNWEWAYKKGLRVIMTNDVFNLCQYCAEIGSKLLENQ